MAPEVHNSVSGFVTGNVIQAHTVSMPAPPPLAVWGLPPQQLFVGRETELSALASALARSHVAVAGLPGVGKTALAVQAAKSFPGDHLMVDMRGYDSPVSPASALASLLTALGVRPEHLPAVQPDLERLWRSTLTAHTSPLLIIVDNASTAAQVTPLFPGDPRHRALITSRHTLADLEATHLIDLNTLSDEQSVEMLSQHLSAARNDTRIDEDPEAAQHLAALCGGLPLAIRVTAALLSAEPERPLADLAEALAADHTRLRELEYNTNLSVRAALELSYRHLEPDAARLFRLIALLPGQEICLPATEALAGPDARRIIAALRRAHLIQLPKYDAKRWRMHDLVRLYASELAKEDPERDEALDRLLDYYVGFAESTPAKDLDVEYPNLLAATTTAHATGRFAVLIALTRALRGYFQLRRLFQDSLAVHERAVEVASADGDRSLEAEMLKQTGTAHWRLKNLEAAQSHHIRALRIYLELGDEQGEADTHHCLGSVFTSMGDEAQAEMSQNKAFGLYQSRADLAGMAKTANNMGVEREKLGERGANRARELYEAALEFFQRAGDRAGFATVLGNLGKLTERAGQLAEALADYEQALNIWRQLDDRHAQVALLERLARVYRALDRVEDSLTAQQKADSLRADVRYSGDLEWETDTLAAPPKIGL